MKILVLGDSTTFGAELSDLPVKHFGVHGNDYIDSNGKPRVSPPSDLAWPALLADKLGCEVVNQSIVGGSNDRIFRLAIEQTSQQHWDLVICAWTSVDRFDLTDGTRDLAISVNSHWGINWVKEYIASHWDCTHADINFVTKLIALQSYFAQKKQSYLFVKSTEIKLCNKAQVLEQQIDQKYCVDWDNNFYKWASDCPLGTDKHLLEQGHIRIADIMYQHVCKLQIGF